MIISTKQAPKSIEHILRAGLVAMLHGSPGTAKSSIVMQTAERRQLKVIDLRLSQCDPTDLAGFPSVDKERGKAGYLPMDTFPVEGDELPEGKKGWLLLLDELPSASTAVQAAAYKLVLDRQVGQHNLHKDVHIIGAGNLASDKAIVNRMSTAMQSRLVHLHIEMDAPSWVRWATKNNIDYRVISYINYQPQQLHNFNPDHNDFTFPCARTWEFVSRLITGQTKLDGSLLGPICGAVDRGTGREFVTFCGIFDKLPSLADIMTKPTQIDIPKEPSVLFAITGYLAEHFALDNFDKMYKYIIRLPKEFQVICLQALFDKDSNINQTEQWMDWAMNNSQDYLDESEEY